MCTKEIWATQYVQGLVSTDSIKEWADFNLGAENEGKCPDLKSSEKAGEEWFSLRRQWSARKHDLLMVLQEMCGRTGGIICPSWLPALRLGVRTFFFSYGMYFWVKKLRFLQRNTYLLFVD